MYDDDDDDDDHFDNISSLSEERMTSARDGLYLRQGIGSYELSQPPSCKLSELQGNVCGLIQSPEPYLDLRYFTIF